LMVHPESRARIERFHQWRPNILTDHHEMGTNSTFFFQPGIPSRRNPLTPEKNVRLTELVAKYHATAFDAAGKLYFTEQAFDDFYYGKGSTYPDIHGAVGILFEQASSRGHLQENSFGSLSLADAVKNQLTSSLSTLKAAHEQRDELLKWQKQDALNVLGDAANAKVQGYVFGEPEDPMRALIMARTLHRHGIEVHALKQPVTIGTQTLSQGYVVATNQLQYRLIRSLFETVTKFGDNTFYDVSTWHFPSAFGVLCEAYDVLPTDLIGPALEDPELPAPHVSTEWGEAYAYAFSWQPYFSPRAAYRLMKAGVKLRFANKPFSAQTSYGEQHFGRGAILLPVGVQDMSSEALDLLLKRVAGEDGIAVHAIRSGLTPEGIDLGSTSFAELKLPKVALLCGSGTDPSSVGPLWHLLDARMDIPVTLLDVARVGRADLSVYTHLVLPSGKYSGLAEKEVAKIKDWNEAGGTLVLLGSACKWAITQKLTTATLLAEEKDTETVERLPFEEQAQRKAFERISGAAFSADLDLTHPLGYGFSRQRVALFRNSTVMLEPSKDAYGTVLQYEAAPLISGYVSAENLGRLAGSAAVITHGQKRGQVVLITDPPNFRGYWLGTNKLFLNSLFFKFSRNQ